MSSDKGKKTLLIDQSEQKERKIRGRFLFDVYMKPFDHANASIGYRLHSSIVMMENEQNLAQSRTE